MGTPIHKRILPFLALALGMATANGQEQLLAYQNGLYCKVHVEQQKTNADTLYFLLRAEWLNKQLRPVINPNDYVVLKPENISFQSKASLTLPDFNHQKFIAFNKDFVLKVVYGKSPQKEKIDLWFDFELSKKNELGEYGPMGDVFAYKQPENLSFFTYTEALGNQVPVENKLAFSLQLLSPEPLPDKEIKADKAEMEFIGKAFSPSGINAVLINSESAQLIADGIFKQTIKLNPGMNDVKISVINNDGEIKSEMYRVNCTDFSNASTLINAGKYYALIIAINDYQDPSINDLTHAISDAKALHKTLIKNYTFEPENTKLLINPTREKLIIEMDRLSKEITIDDNLLIFYAGHGYWSEKASQGYWLPSDAKKSNTAFWIGNSTIRDYIAAIHSKHTLLIADACFSGGIFKTRSAFSNSSNAVEKLYNLPSRKAMTSGTIEEVPDQSVFIKYLIKRMEENKEPFLPSEMLFANLKTAVLNNSNNIPQYGEINNTGDEGGDFIFIKRR
jgi:hypothetical protein